ncbi:hypothetical protein POM88_051817 [Heracleum sosnowskyi]|uniref:Replication protein A 70 kDa DNA-binding subunit B/D first OB fold domain-containing protein n=1 Tax=Heracleum sosnowskyi TaxID=360622 RepID=A0AAD8M2R3_9APIA|nr:hypothetical protein POM88_051817 [Heracleum sosnowskyi]
MSFNQYDTFASLNDLREDWIIKVRAQAIWKGITKNTGEFRGYNIIFFDDSSERIHAFITTLIVPKFEKKLAEGQIYIIEKFKIKYYKGDETNRVVRNEKHIFFTEDTKLEKATSIGLNIQNHSFDFYNLQDVAAMKQDNRFLTVIEDVQPKAVYNKETVEKSHVPFTVTDGRTTLNVTFFNEFGEAFLNAREKIVEEPVIIVISAAKVTEWQGKTYLTNFPSTRFYLNLDHSAVSALRLRQSMANFYNMDIDAEIEPEVPIMKVTEIRKLKKDYPQKSVACQIRVKKFDENMSWFSPYCSKCETDLKLVDENWRCTECNRNKLYPDRRFRLYSLCSDDSGAIPIIWPNEEICRLTGKCVYDLEGDDPQVDAGKILPSVLKAFEKKSYKITIKLTKENLEEGSNVYTAYHISAPIEMSGTHSPNNQKVLPIHATQMSTQITDNDLISKDNSPPTEKSTNKSRPRMTVEIVDSDVQGNPKIQKIMNIKLEEV